MEISLCIKDAIDAYHNVDKWAKTEKAPFTLNFAALKPIIRKEPKGVVLIIRLVVHHALPKSNQISPSSVPSTIPHGSA